MGVKEDIMKFATDNPVAYMATVDGTQPRVRAFDMYRVYENGFYFHNNATKGVRDQLMNNQKVELFFPSRDGTRPALRVLGRAQLTNDKAEEYYSIPEKHAFKDKDHYKPAEETPMIRVTGKAWFRTARGKRGKLANDPAYAEVMFE